MAEGIYMGGVKSRGKINKDIRALVAEINKQKEEFADAAGKFNILNQFTDIIGKAGNTLFTATGNPLFLLGNLIDYGVDQTFGSKIMEDAGDPEAIKKLETPWTGGGYGEELEKMIEETEPDPLADFVSELTETGMTFATTEGLDLLGEQFAEWFPKTPDVPEVKSTEVSPFGWQAREGGYVPKKYYGGGSVQGGAPTISDYFGMRGKTLGGSNKQSLSERLGRS